MSRTSLSLRLAACLSATAFIGLTVGAITSQAATMKPAHAKMAAAKVYYVCTKCHEYWTPAAAKKIHYKDSMGHTLVKVSKVPKGYMSSTAPGAM